ncbi:hypothetical protein CKO51_02000 [Rhodopirellula sp. SM50]|nr:hypothetical protein CKO51_02000 [Rhodopirellula sp. SM50]
MTILLAVCTGIGSAHVAAQDVLPPEVLVRGKITGGDTRRPAGSLYQRVWEDHRYFYSRDSLLLLGGSFAIGATMAHSSADVELQQWFGTSVRGATSDDWYEGLHANKELGNGRYTLPLFATAWLAGTYFESAPIASSAGQWGERSLRSVLVGAPPMLLSQRLTGGARPGESSSDARWQPFNDNNGVSGHSFMSALPFINAAKLCESRWGKAAFYAGSLLGPLSRVNDDAHYSSQVALGWSFAFLSATAIDQTERDHARFQIRPWVAESGATGASVEFRY